MKTLFTIDLKDYDESWQRSRRDSARAIIHVGADKLALVYATKLGYYKFPGGGIHEEEDKIAALVREVQEEVGLVVVPETVRDFGVASRYQKSGMADNTIFVQDNFYYECEVEKDGDNLKIISQNLDDYENKAGFELQIVSIADAISNNKNYKDPDSFNTAMIARDTRVLEMLLSGE